MKKLFYFIVLVNCSIMAPWYWPFGQKEVVINSPHGIIARQIEEGMGEDIKDKRRFHDIALKVLEQIKERDKTIYEDARQTYEIQEQLKKAIGVDIEAQTIPTPASDISESSRYVKDQILIQFYRDKHDRLKFKFKMGSRFAGVMITGISGLAAYLAITHSC